MPQEQLLFSSSIRAFAKWIFDDDASTLGREDLAQLNCAALAPGILQGQMKEDISHQEKQQFLRLQARDLAQQQAMLQIAKILTENQIPFCPVKGADLAPRVYPAGALRPHYDLDVLILQEHRKRAFTSLQQAGWQQPYRFVNDNHEANMFHHDISLELHYKLPNFAQKDMAEVWQDTIEIAPCHHRLSLEFNLLMLFQHSFSHQWRSKALLTDMGFLLKKEGKPNWVKIHTTAKKMHLCDPALLFRAFEDFFPAEMMPAETFPPEICTAFRKQILMRPFQKRTHQELAMRDVNRFSRQWWKARFHGLRPSVIRCATGNPRGHYIKLCRDYLIINGKKIFAFGRDLQKIRTGNLPVENADEKEIEKFLISADGQKE